MWQAGSMTFAPLQTLARSLGLQMPVVVQSMYIFKVSALSWPQFTICKMGRLLIPSPSVQWAKSCWNYYVGGRTWKIGLLWLKHLELS